jgi:hypothetical protein
MVLSPYQKEETHSAEQKCEKYRRRKSSLQISDMEILIFEPVKHKQNEK